MAGEQFTLAIAFVAGFVSFLSPCVLPLIPGFLAYLAGSGGKPGTTSEGGVSAPPSKPSRGALFLTSVFFVLGFSVVFAALGVLLNTALEAVAYDVQIWLSRVGGVIIIFFGLFLTGLFKIRFLERPHAFRVTRRFGSRYFTAFVFGFAFAVGWTPCVGAVLGGILGLAASAPGSAFSLLLAYAIGLGVPFLAVGLFASEATRFLTKFARAAKVINIVFGIILVALGILVFTQNLSRIANLEILNRWLLREP